MIILLEFCYSSYPSCNTYLWRVRCDKSTRLLSTGTINLHGI